MTFQTLYFHVTPCFCPVWMMDSHFMKDSCIPENVFLETHIYTIFLYKIKQTWLNLWGNLQKIGEERKIHAKDWAPLSIHVIKKWNFVDFPTEVNTEFFKIMQQKNHSHKPLANMNGQAKANKNKKQSVYLNYDRGSFILLLNLSPWFILSLVRTLIPLKFLHLKHYPCILFFRDVTSNWRISWRIISSTSVSQPLSLPYSRWDFTDLLSFLSFCDEIPWVMYAKI